MIYERIRNLREDNDLTPKQLAEYLNISQNTYSQYENGIIEVTPDTAARLAKYYGTSVDYLLGLTDVKKPYPPKAK